MAKIILRSSHSLMAVSTVQVIKRQVKKFLENRMGKITDKVYFLPFAQRTMSRPF